MGLCSRREWRLMVVWSGILAPAEASRGPGVTIAKSEAAHDMCKVRLADAANEAEDSAHQAPRVIQMYEPALQASADPDRLVATLRQPANV